MTVLLIFSVLVIFGLSMTLVVYHFKNKKGKNIKAGYYCDLYKDSQLLDSGLCSAAPDCDECPHKKRLV